jgi:hypothetical protein
MVEFRLYYDDNGDVLYYTCDNPIGNFIVIDAQTYAECRFDIKDIDGKIVKQNRYTIMKLVPNNEGTECIAEDITIIANENYKGNTTKWKLKVNEYEN